MTNLIASAKMKFSFSEQVDMLLIYGEVQRNFVIAKTLYAERHPDRTCPSHRMFQRLCEKLRQIDSLTARIGERRKKCIMKTTASMCLQKCTIILKFVHDR